MTSVLPLNRFSPNEIDKLSAYVTVLSLVSVMDQVCHLISHSHLRRDRSPSCSHADDSL